MKQRTWKVVKWESRPPGIPDGEPIPLMCPCGYDAMMPTAGHPGCLIIAAVGMGLITDPPGMRPPKSFMPDEVQCRRCRKVYGSDEAYPETEEAVSLVR